MSKKKMLEFDIQGMTCDTCPTHVEKALKRVAGVESVDIPGWRSNRATVIADGEVASEELAASVARAGYRATVKTNRPIKDALESDGPESTNGRGGGDFDLMVIGAGSGGFAAAIKGAELGQNVALVEDGTIGGTCVNVGCVPSKTLIRAMETYHLAGEGRFRGVDTRKEGLNWPEVKAHKDELVAELRQAKYLDVLEAYPQITYIQGRANFASETTIEINGRAYSPGKVVLATGAHPWVPPIPGLEGTNYLTSTTAMDLEELPESMIVLGANAVGLELAQVFSRARVKVSVVELMDRIAPFEDQDMSEALAVYLEEEGLQIITGYRTQNVKEKGGRFYLEGTVGDRGETIEADALLVATGRRPNTANMGLEEAGVDLGKKGEVLVNEFMQTSNPNIYAVGDVIGKDMFVYVAAYAGGLAAENSLTLAGKVFNDSYIARITFTDPLVASAGLTEAAAVDMGYSVKVSTLAMEHVPRALAARDTRGLIKLVADSSTDQLLGLHIVAPEAGEMIQIGSMALKLGLTVSDLRETIFPYLTNVEGLKLAAIGFEKDVAMLSCCAG